MSEEVTSDDPLRKQKIGILKALRAYATRMHGDRCPADPSQLINKKPGSSYINVTSLINTLISPKLPPIFIGDESPEPKIPNAYRGTAEELNKALEELGKPPAEGKNGLIAMVERKGSRHTARDFTITPEGLEYLRQQEIPPSAVEPTQDVQPNAAVQPQSSVARHT